MFVVQDDISQAIAEALRLKLSLEKGPGQEEYRPKNLEAYDYYTR